LRKKKLQQLKEQQFWSTFFYFNVPKHLTEIPAHIDRVNFRIWDHVEDDHLLLMLSKVKSINMLDLDETDITNEGIKYLTKLEQLKELRLKGIQQIDDDCMEQLNQIKDLELLHLGGTSVTLDGLSKLSDLQKLKVLLLSVPEAEEIKEKMLLLNAMLPHCEFILNYKSYEFDEENNNTQQLQ